MKRKYEDSLGTRSGKVSFASSNGQERVYQNFFQNLELESLLVIGVSREEIVVRYQESPNQNHVAQTQVHWRRLKPKAPGHHLTGMTHVETLKTVLLLRHCWRVSHRGCSGGLLDGIFDWSQKSTSPKWPIRLKFTAEWFDTTSVSNMMFCWHFFDNVEVIFRT